MSLMLGMQGLRLVTIASLLSLSGCATMLSDGVDRVTITTGDMEETRIFVDDLLVGWQEADVSMKRGEIHTIRVERDGCETTELETSLVFDHNTWGGVSLLGIGMAADVATGNAWKIDQRHYTVLPDCSTALNTPASYKREREAG